MRVAYVCLDPGVPVFGRKGSSIHCQEMMRAFQHRGDEVELFAVRMGTDVPGDLQRIRAHRFSAKLPSDPAAREVALAELNPVTRQLLTDAQPFDLIYERYSLWSHAAMQFARDNNIPGVLEVNSPLIDEQKAYRTLIDESCAKTIRGKCFRHASSIVAVSEQVAERIRCNYFARYKTVAIPNGVNCDKFLPAAGSAVKRDRFVIGFVGTLKPWHGVENLLDSFAIVHAEFPQAVLKIVGDGPQREHLEQHLAQHPERVRRSVYWLGAVPNAEMPQILSTLDVAVAPYPQIQEFYFSPLKILEYMAAGLPVVASRIGQIPTLVEPEETGLLVTPGCKHELAQALLRLSSDPLLRGRLGAAARQHVENHHTWQSVLDRILATVSTTDFHCEVR
jgi:glycosyltransferase involved in cell wall biosynthesis